MAGDGETCFPSPGGRVKFLCSFGGKIVPRPSDKLLRYVGGETRLVAVPRSVSFSELRKKMASVFNAEVSIKYQLPSEDLDALVSVACDEDVHHLLEEHDLNEACSWPTRLRIFLFPAGGAAVKRQDNRQLAVAPGLERRYVDAINGVARPAESPLPEVHRVQSSPNLRAAEIDGIPADEASGMGAMRRRRPPPLHIAGRYYHSPAGTPRGDGSSARACCGHVMDPSNHRSPVRAHTRDSSRATGDR